MGRQRCHRFGAWSTTAHPLTLDFDLGLVSHRYDGPRGASGTDDINGDRFSYRLATDPNAPPIVMVGPRVRVTFGEPGWYLGYEAGYQHAQSTPAIEAQIGSEMLDAHAASLLENNFVFGMRARHDAVTFGGEVALGVLVQTYPTRCPSGEGCYDTPEVFDLSMLAEARARGDLWITPTLSIGVTAGLDPFARGDASLVLSLSEHLVPFGGM
ncbi:MAG TPA: hypothetical protein VMJ10_32455 [Kofleriaceae bacterium]|nr:hypothetical protein [Kofleriaceae bacterium]